MSASAEAIASRDVMPSPDLTLGMTRSMVTLMQFNEQRKDYEDSLGHLDQGSAEYSVAADACHQRGANRCLRIAQMHGGIYVKAAQFVASIRGGSGDRGIPRQYIDTLSALTDHAPHKPISKVAEGLSEALGSGLMSVIAGLDAAQLDEACDVVKIDAVPIASASLAQVHRAQLRDGTSVAVKVQYPELQKELASDFAVFRTMGAKIKEIASGYDVMWVVEDLEKNVSVELDFEGEARNADVTRSQLSHRAPVVYIPQTFPKLSSKRVLTMEFCEGLLKTNDPVGLRSAGLDVDECATLLCETFAEMIFIHGRVHADPHAGNIYFRAISEGSQKKPQLVILDHGLYYDLELNNVRGSFCKFWKACCAKDSLAMESSGRHLAGELYRLLPLILSPWFALVAPSVSLNEIKAAANGQLPETVGIGDVVDFLSAARAGGGNVVGLLHSLGYIRGLLQDLGFREANRLSCMLKFAMLGDEPRQASGMPRELTMGQRMQVYGSIWQLQCKLAVMAPLARMCMHCCGEKRNAASAKREGTDLYGISQVSESEPKRPKLAQSSEKENAEQAPDIPKPEPSATSGCSGEAAASESQKELVEEDKSEVAEQSSQKDPPQTSQEEVDSSSTKQDVRDNSVGAAGAASASNQPEKPKPPLQNHSKTASTHQNNDGERAPASPKKKAAPKKQSKSPEKAVPESSEPTLTKEQSKKALFEATQLLEQPKNAKKLKAAVKKAKAESEDPLGQQLAMMEYVLPLAQEILSDILKRYGFPPERLMLALLMIKKHSEGDESMKREVERITNLIQGSSS